MSPLPRSLSLLLWSFLIFVPYVFANTEKIIFLGPESIDLPQDGPSIEDLGLVSLSPQTTTYRGALPVVFANGTYPKGLQSWYVLHDLTPGARYEVRVCWAATQPTAWDMDVFTLKETMETPELIQSLAMSAEERTTSRGPQDVDQTKINIQSPQSLLFLRLSGAADYFTLKKDLMTNPKPVKIDIILDPYTFNVFPRSLISTAGYIVVVAVAGFFVSNFVWSRLSESADSEKEHKE
ncbi:hypothetical protein BDZ85DRAFT_218838 [Elsinoe ampelina]|uniref:Uncharacterized protein n=1 Tax=Elsinoe ampelina TaxID=302913 RepID=A0A6A6GBW4_9PEZI|nr:hypothetical protein BDZ85DRAFT_218838 [Elsinoe ampelina]